MRRNTLRYCALRVAANDVRSRGACASRHQPIHVHWPLLQAHEISMGGIGVRVCMLHREVVKNQVPIISTSPSIARSISSGDALPIRLRSRSTDKVRI